MVMSLRASAGRIVGAACALFLTGGVMAAPGKFLVINRVGSSVLEFNGANAGFLGTFSGAGVSPTDMTWGPDGDLYITDATDNAVLRVDGKTGQAKGYFVQPGAGGLSKPQSLVFGPDGDLYVAGTPDSTIVRYNGATGAYVKTVFMAGATVPGQITFGADGLIYYVCQTCKAVKVVDPDLGIMVKMLVLNDQEGPGVARGMAWGPNGNVFLTSGGPNDTIREYDGVTGKFIRTFAEGGMDEPYDVVFGNGVMYVASGASGNVMIFDAETGALIREGAAQGQGGLEKAAGVVEVPEPPCYPDFDGNGSLDLFDFLAYVNEFNAGTDRSDCTQDGTRDLFDFLCYVNAFNAGCR